MPKRMWDVWQRFRVFPPVLCRLMARQPHGRVLSEAELSRRSGLPLHQIHTLSRLISWEGVDLPTARKFLQACETDFTTHRQWRRMRDYLRKNCNWAYLKKDPMWSTLYRPLLSLYVQSIRVHTEGVLSPGGGDPLPLPKALGQGATEAAEDR